LLFIFIAAKINANEKADKHNEEGEDNSRKMDIHVYIVSQGISKMTTFLRPQIEIKEDDDDDKDLFVHAANQGQ
jgi:hypothetical protein